MSTLRIAGIHRSSNVDFPHRTASVIFVQGCNLRCPWCRQGRLVGVAAEREAPRLEPETCLSFIAARRDLIDGVVVTGGEPLLQDSLPGFLASIKELGLQVKLDTNGTMPHRLERALDEGLIDYVALDVKAPPSNAGAYCIASGGHVDTTRIQDSIALVAEKAPQGEYRTTALPGFHDYEMLSKIIAELPIAVPFYLQLFIPELARSGQWSQQRRWSRDRLDSLAQRLALDFPLHWIESRA